MGYVALLEERGRERKRGLERGMATTNSKMELYKARHNRGNGLGSREARSKLKTAQSRNDREAVLMSRRRIPLSEIRDEEPRKNSGESRAALGCLLKPLVKQRP